MIFKGFLKLFDLEEAELQKAIAASKALAEEEASQELQRKQAELEEELESKRAEKTSKMSGQDQFPDLFSRPKAGNLAMFDEIDLDADIKSQAEDLTKKLNNERRLQLAKAKEERQR